MQAEPFFLSTGLLELALRAERVQLRSKNGDILTAEEEMEALCQHWQKVFDMRSLPEQDWCLVNPMDIGLDEVRSAIQSLAASLHARYGTECGVEIWGSQDC